MSERIPQTGVTPANTGHLMCSWYMRDQLDKPPLAGLTFQEVCKLELNLTDLK